MYIHSKVLTIDHLHRAANQNSLALRDGAQLIVGQRSRKLKARIERLAPRLTDFTELDPRVQENVRFYGASWSGDTRRNKNASWAEHGYWFSSIFDFDPDAILVSGQTRYSGLTDFNKQTNSRFCRP